MKKWPFFRHAFESQLLELVFPQLKSDLSIIQLKHHLLFKLIMIYKRKSGFAKPRLSVSFRIKMTSLKILDLLFFLMILIHSNKAIRVLSSEEKLEFVRSSVSLIEGKDIMDTCFILNFGYEASLPWPQV